MSCGCRHGFRLCDFCDRHLVKAQNDEGVREENTNIPVVVSVDLVTAQRPQWSVYSDGLLGQSSVNFVSIVWHIDVT